MLIEQTVLKALCAGSFEQIAEQIASAVAATLGDVNVLATHPMHAVVVDADGGFHQVIYECRDGRVVEVVTEPLKVPVIDDAEQPRYVACEAQEIVRLACEGKLVGDALRTRVHGLAQMVEQGVGYFASDAVLELQVAEDDAWYAWYARDVQKVRQRVVGSIREREDMVPAPLGAIPAEKWADRELDLTISIQAMRSALGQLVDECAGLGFDENNELDAITRSLNGEALAMGAALEKAGRLMLTRDVGMMAETHDRLAKRVKQMVIVAEYLKRTRATNEQER
jgi:hypothetical protein